MFDLDPHALSWDEGGTNRIVLHVAGGALVAGLGGGGIASAAQGAAGAGIAAWAAGDLNRLANGTRDALGGGDAAQMAGNVLANVVAGAGGFLIGGTTGAFSAGNADLYNRSTGNGDGKGSTANSALGWVGDQLASAGRGAVNFANQFAGLVNANGPQGPYVSPDDLNGPGGNSKPPATGGSAVPVVVCVPPVCAVAVAPTPGMPGFVPGNATLNSSGSGQDANQTASPQINPSDVAGRNAQDIAQHAIDHGLIPKGPDPMNGRGAYVDPVTGQQRVLIHPDEPCPHCHVNDSSGARLDINGNRVPSESPDAHLPLKK